MDAAYYYCWVLFLLLYPDQLTYPDHCPRGMLQLQIIARRLDIAGEIEPWGTSFRLEMIWCRDQLRKSHGLPPSSDLARFPDYETCNKFSAFGERHIEWLQGELVLRPHDERLQDAMEETRLRLKAWDSLSFAQLRGTYTVTRRQNLNCLRHKIGEAAYNAGAMPCPVPADRFQEIR